MESEASGSANDPFERLAVSGMRNRVSRNLKSEGSQYGILESTSQQNS